MDKGQIVEQGTHQELLKIADGIYKGFRITSYNVCYTKLLRPPITKPTEAAAI